MNLKAKYKHSNIPCYREGNITSNLPIHFDGRRKYNLNCRNETIKRNGQYYLRTDLVFRTLNIIGRMNSFPRRKI
jgi:hypothetical protein